MISEQSTDLFFVLSHLIPTNPFMSSNRILFFPASCSFSIHPKLIPGFSIIIVHWNIICNYHQSIYSYFNMHPPQPKCLQPFAYLSQTQNVPILFPFASFNSCPLLHLHSKLLSSVDHCHHQINPCILTCSTNHGFHQFHTTLISQNCYSTLPSHHYYLYK